ncbi:hypothetical protein BDV93DRAFT_546856 [Ceratobasidium sp. AG-I]|nr:hypothetical protein BDV93DRAFT_546856 [Ceratobasidium sp. AG-I]
MDNFYSSETRYPGYEQDLDELARRHGSRFKSLIFTMHKENPVGQTIFHAACTQHTEASVRLESLAVYGYYYPSEDSVGNMGWPSKDLMDRYLMSVRFLDVKGRLFDDWTSTVFHNLTTLRLESIADQVRPTCEEFLDVLRASPRLCSLQLDSPLVNAIPSSNANPVTLNTLDLVWLKGSEPEFVRWLLNAIVSHAGGLTLVLERVRDQDRRVTLGLNPPPSMLDGVKILYLLGDCHHRALPRLETLALESVEIQSSDLFVYVIAASYHPAKDFRMLLRLHHR